VSARGPGCRRRSWGGDWLLASADGCHRPGAVAHRAAGVRDARVHDARHTAATFLLAQGVDQRVVMEILGHSQISMTSRYAHVLPQVMTDAADRIGQGRVQDPV
jgi:integrase